MMTMSEAGRSPAELLDEANAAVFRKHYRSVLDRGITGPDSALTAGPAGPGSPGLLADLAGNAAVFAAARAKRGR